MSIITFIKADDWCGLYELWFEGHSMDNRDWLDLLEGQGATVTNLSETPEAYAAIVYGGRCPSEWPPA
jgi:hypothetical protein